MQTMRTKLVGVTMADEGRQSNIMALQPGQQLTPDYETDNPFDPNAIKLYADAEKTKPLGYIKKEVARDISEQKKRGWQYTFYCEAVTGKETQTKGCNIRIEATKEVEFIST